MSGSAVILSGGLDSTVCMAMAAGINRSGSNGCNGNSGVYPPSTHERPGALLAITFDYGQRTRREIDSAERVAAHYGAEHLTVPLDMRRWGGSALVDVSIDIPDGPPRAGAIPITYVPARNIIFLSVGLGIAEARDLDALYIGVNALDYSGYPDCRPEFIEAFRQVAAVGQARGVEGRPVEIRVPLIDMPKAEIVNQGLSLGAPFELTWSCYLDADTPCGTCESCVLRAKGFADAGVADPAMAR